uniref:Olduvai domain-containing protein n=1 Tax=Mustela putorius furo TaxID=9669 RepID=M3XNF3_MUSPF
MDQDGLKGQESVAPSRLSKHLLEVVEKDTSWDSPDECYLTYSVLPDLSDSYWPYKSTAIFSPENPEVCSSLEGAKNQFHCEEKEDQDLVGPRLSMMLPEVKEQDAQGDSLGECSLTDSPPPESSDQHATYRRADINSFKDMGICSALELTSKSSTVKEVIMIFWRKKTKTRFTPVLLVTEGSTGSCQ